MFGIRFRHTFEITDGTSINIVASYANSFRHELYRKWDRFIECLQNGSYKGEKIEFCHYDSSGKRVVVESYSK